MKRVWKKSKIELDPISFIMNRFRAIKIWFEIYFMWWPHSVDSSILFPLKKKSRLIFIFFISVRKDEKKGRCTGTSMIQKRVRAFVLPPFFIGSLFTIKIRPKMILGKSCPRLTWKGREGVDKSVSFEYDYVTNSLWLLFSAGMHVDSYCSGITSQSCVISSFVCRLDVEPAEEIIYLLFFNDG